MMRDTELALARIIEEMNETLMKIDDDLKKIEKAIKKIDNGVI